MGGAFWTILSIILVLLWIGVMYLWFMIRHFRREPLVDPKNGLRLLTVLGSGGHTTEMLDLLKHFNDEAYSNRTYVVADTDNHSERKALESEQARHSGTFVVEKIPRSREVGQSYLTSVFTTAYASLHAFIIVSRIRPSIVLVNGPGTCVPVAISAALLDMLRVANTRIVYVESICRVERLSLTAAILYYSGLADDVIVQWPQLKDTYPRVRTLDEMS
ncbi:algn-14 [Pristionchus pacificus]|uniref:UDP-N-acetylglucosamine transferase subunit ALG14 n=1 Tax=Pristionchus pacificus TaxID=54126 RepID=A0A454XTX2_PRIPA|nr:algn-14 [Pristionchus pacificus]|eukprot:PDM82694.1 algn-14 [Pristionchus pacificus]